MEATTMPSPLPKQRQVIVVGDIRELLSHPERWDYMRESILMELDAAHGRENSIEALEIQITQRAG